VDSKEREDDKLAVLGDLTGDEVHDSEKRRVVVVLPSCLLLFSKRRCLLIVSHYQNYISTLILEFSTTKNITEHEEMRSREMAQKHLVVESIGFLVNVIR
jgi:hypothetical protein